MAIFPQGLTQVDQRCNPGERRVLHQLKRCLEDDYLVWHDVPIGPRARQPDFVILSPRWGVLLLEVKDWKLANLGPANRDAVELITPRGRVTQAHPLRQARDYAMELVDLMQRDPALVHARGAFAGKLLFPYGWGVVMSHLKRADVADTDFDGLFAPSKTLLRDDLDETLPAATFQQRLWGLFTVNYPHTLTLPQRDRVRWHLFPEVRLNPQPMLDFDLADAGKGAPFLPDLMQVMDLQQEQIARSMGDGHRVIHGVAGSGKTMILIYRAQHLAAAARADRPILVMCFNRTLADRIDALLRQRGVDERVQVRTFHAWCQDMVRSYQLTVPPALRGDAYFEALANVVERGVATGLVPAGQYTALMIDEAHDFKDAWLRIATRMVAPGSDSLLVLYDDAQSIYQKQRRRKFSFASVGIEARGRTSILKLNYRNTAEVLALAMHCAASLLEGVAADSKGVADTAAGDARGSTGTGTRANVHAGSDAMHDIGDGPSGSTSGGASGNGSGNFGDDAPPLVIPASAGRRGALPVLIEARDSRDEAALVADRIGTALAAGRPADEIAVLCRAKHLMVPIEAALAQRGITFQSMNTQAFRRFDWHRPSVKLLTLHSAKGLEFAQVHVAGLQALPMHDEPLDDAVRLLYVAMTRATHELVLSTHGRSAVVDKVRKAVGEVTARFAVADRG